MDGREPVATTRYVYDRRGRLLRSVTTREPEWTEQDRAEVLALALFRSLRCPCGCGNNIRDTTAPDGEWEWQAFKVRCQARNALSVAQDEHSKRTTHPEAVLWRTRKVRVQPNAEG